MCNKVFHFVFSTNTLAMFQYAVSHLLHIYSASLLLLVCAPLCCGVSAATHSGILFVMAALLQIAKHKQRVNVFS